MFERPNHGSGRRGTMSRRFLLVGLVAAALVIGTAPAGRRSSSAQHYSGSEAFTDDGCGFTLDVVATFYGQTHLRVDDDRPGLPDQGHFSLPRGLHESRYRPVVRAPRPRAVSRHQGHPRGGHRLRVRCRSGWPAVRYRRRRGQRDRSRPRRPLHTICLTRSVTVSPAAAVGDTGFVVHGPHPSLARISARSRQS